MKINIARTAEVFHSALESLTRGLEANFPIPLDTNIINKPIYIPQENLVSQEEIEKIFPPNMLNVHGIISRDGQVYTNLATIQHQLSKDEKTILLTARPYFWGEGNPIEILLRFVGKKSTSDERDNYEYFGCVQSNRLVIVGGRRNSTSNNYKIAMHELGHIFIDPQKISWEYSHCNNKIGNKYCIMHSPKLVTDEILNNELSLEFCHKCTDLIKN